MGSVMTQETDLETTEDVCMLSLNLKTFKTRYRRKLGQSGYIHSREISKVLQRNCYRKASPLGTDLLMIKSERVTSDLESSVSPSAGYSLEMISRETSH